MRRLLIRITGMLFLITFIGSSLALLIGRFTPAEMLTTSRRAVTLRGNRYSADLNTFVLIDLNRHLRAEVIVSLDEAIERTVISENGQEALLQIGTKLYRYNLITEELQELNWTYTNPETGSVYQIQNIYSSPSRNGDLWDYNPADGAVYHYDTERNLTERVVTLIDINDSSTRRLSGNQILTVSPSGTQVVLVDYSIVYIFNIDGSNLQRYSNLADEEFGSGNFSYGYWSQDEQYFYVYRYLDSSNSRVSFRIIDLNSGETLPTTQDLEGYSFSPCWEGDELAYTDVEYKGYLLNFPTGETQNLSLIPEFADQPIEYISWLNGCDWMMVRIGVPNNNIGIGYEHQPIYIVSRDGQTVYPLGEQVAVLDWIDNDSFLLTEAHGIEDNVYQVDFDGTVHQTEVGHFVYQPETWMSHLSNDPYRLLVYEGGQLTFTYVLDIRTSAVETYFEPNETIISFPTQWLWD